ncbi:MAG TPA: SPOR domain-containing protein [Gammaproteobacteria bacterium]|nr:SPOR domain-containing protein [Gammaproteobacteria bacterium]
MKERLVGAAVLVAIAVWLIPWVLDGPEDGAEAAASSLQLPTAEEPVPMRTQILKLGEAPEPSAGSAAAPTATATQQQAAAAPAKPAADPPKTSTDSPKASADSPKPAEQAVAEPKREPEREQTVAAAARVADSAATPPKAAGGDWTVQLGSFEDEANAKRMAQRAGTFGYKAEVSASRDGARTLYRVRVGPQATKAAADAAASALRAHGVEARVVAAR